MSKILLSTVKAPMQQNTKIAGNSSRYGTASSRTHSPTSGRFSTSSIKLPSHIEAIRPQNSSGRSVMTCGPGAMPWIISAPIISAMVGFDGIPRVSIGMNEVCAPALLALSGAATPRMSPSPNILGGFATFFSSI